MGQLSDRIAQKQKMLYPDSPEVVAALMKIGIKLEADIKRNIRRARLIDQGALINSIKHRIVSEGKAGILQVGSWGVPYARIHEYGGVIRPKKAKWLTIPVAKFSKRRFARDFRLAFFPIDGGRKLAAVDKDRNQLAFVLVKKVVHKPKRFMRDALEKNTNYVYDTIRKLFQ